MSRIATLFSELLSQNKKALIPYVTAGDPYPHVTVPLLHSMVENGANIIELGVPFSDPMADGPVIQKACERALAGGMSLNAVLDMVREFRTTDKKTPIILMGYLNPIEAMGYQSFALKAEDSGVDGVLVVDMPPEESRPLIRELRNKGIDSINLLAPTSSDERIQKIAEVSSGFIYYVSLRGVTGSQEINVAEIVDRLKKIHAVSDLPVAVGFGIKDAKSASRVSDIADAVIAGTALVKEIEQLVPELDQESDPQIQIKRVSTAVNRVLTNIKQGIEERGSAHE
jgi:tryptophan synthase alpha chain